MVTTWQGVDGADHAFQPLNPTGDNSCWQRNDEYRLAGAVGWEITARRRAGPWAGLWIVSLAAAQPGVASAPRGGLPLSAVYLSVYKATSVAADAATSGNLCRSYAAYEKCRKIRYFRKQKSAERYENAAIILGEEEDKRQGRTKSVVRRWRSSCQPGGCSRRRHAVTTARDDADHSRNNRRYSTPE